MNEPTKGKTYPWKKQKKAYDEALKYVYNRKQGTVTSFKTPWDKLMMLELMD